MDASEKFLLAKRLLLDFKEYVKWIHKLAQGSEYDMTASHIKMCDAFQRFAECRNVKRNLLINCPPGTGKSLLLQYFITWCFARNKNNMFCYVAYGERLIKKLSRESRNLMMMPEWEELFGKEMDPNDKSVLNYHLISGGVRSGLTAGTVSSALLGLDAGVPGVEGFSGALLCFPYDTKVVTENGEEDIGYLAENRVRTKVLSSGGWADVTGWQVNPGSDIVEICYDGGTLRCTPDHKVNTDHGWVRADSLKPGDIVIGSQTGLFSGSNLFNLADIKTILGASSVSWQRFDVRNNSFWDWDKVCSLGSCNGRELSSGDDIIKQASANAKKLSSSCIYFDNLFSRKFGMGKTKVAGRISHIFLSGSVFKVFGSIIERIVIDMTNITTRWFGTQKSSRDRNVHKLMPTRPVNVRGKNKVTNVPVVRSGSSFYKMLCHNLFRHYVKAEVITSGALLGIRITPTLDSPKIRSKVVGVVGDWFPNLTIKGETGILFNACCNFAHSRVLFVKKCNCVENTYCLTVKKYHNFMAKSSGSFVLNVSNCDDINSPEVSTSVHEQIETPDIYQRKLATRRRTPIVPTICIQQRICNNDMSGWILKNEPDEWETVIIPAIDENGESFYPKRYPITELRRIEKQNPYMFAAMYQQHPVENYGAYFHEEWIRTYRAQPEQFEKVFITTDFAFTADGGDYTLFVCWGLAKDKNLYHLRSRMGKWESPDGKKYCIEFFQHCKAAFPKCRRVYVEKTLSGIGFIQDMRRECPEMAIVPLTRGAKKNKMNRVESCMTWMEAGRIYFREADPNYLNMRNQFLAYNPNEKNPKDEWCFVAGTKIMTTRGEKNIEDIRVGDKLWTPIGVTSVLGTSHKTKPVITKIGLTGTEEHKVWNPIHFRFDKLGDVCYFKPKLLARSIKWQILKSYLTTRGISLTKRQDITSSTTQITRSEMEKCFTGLFGNIIRERRYLKAILFIILTMTGVITTTATLCVYRLLSMLRFMGGTKRREKGLLKQRLKTLFRKLENGIRVKKGKQYRQETQNETWNGLKKSENVYYVEKSLNIISQPTLTTEKYVASVKTTGSTKQSDVVYAIKTGNGVYVANSILVSNCDNTGDAAEIAFNMKTGSIFI